MKKKLTSRCGFSISEMLMVVLILGLVTSVIAGGVTVVRDAYYNITLKANAQTLLSTAISAVSDELRNAQNIQEKTDVNNYKIWTFDNAKRGYTMYLYNKKATTSDANETICAVAIAGGSVPLVTDKTHTDGLTVCFDTDKSPKYENGCFSFTITVKYNSKTFASQDMNIRPLDD